MAKFAGIKDGRICVVSNTPFNNKDFKIIEIPPEFDQLSSQDLIADYKFLDNQIVNKSFVKPTYQLKIAFVTNWGMKCGLATYAKFLYPEIIKHIGDFKLFVEQHDNYVHNILEVGEYLIPSNRVSACWKRGESLAQLIKEIKEYNPDIILVNHEFGLWPNARYWIAFCSQLSNYRLIVTMHSNYRHKDKTIVESCIPEIIVHLDSSKTLLKEEKQLSSQIYVIPHGCFPCTDKTKLWNYYKSEHTFVQFGFLFRYKGFEKSIKAVSLLKEKYPDIFFTGLCSESPFAKIEHDLYYQELSELIEQLGLQDNVGLVRGFQSDNVIDSYLRTNKAAIFPYVSNKEHECFGSSGAAPYTMNKAIPVITSSIHHFENLPSIKADSPEEIAKELDILFSDWKVVQNQVDKQNQYLEENSWANVALKYIEIFRNNLK